MYKSKKISRKLGRKSRKVRRGGSNNKTTCENTFCKKYLEYISKMTNKMNDNLVKMYEKIPLKDRTPDIINTLKKMKSKKMTKEKLESIRLGKEMCSNSFCNVGCKDTLFEPGTKVPDIIFQKMKNKDPKFQKVFKELMNNTRKNIFGNKTNVLKDNFYEKFKDPDKIKKQGAISGCALASLI
jgi:hypothetical protein